MSQSLIITTKKDNMLEFEAEVKGIRDPKMSIQFVIKADDMNFAFPAKHEKDDTWSVNIPPLSILKHKDYPYMITVDLEGYHFEPMTGDLTVVGEIEPVVSKPEKVEKKSEAKAEEQPKPEEKKEEKKVAPAVEKKEEPKEEPEEEKKEEVKETDAITQTVNNIINREKLRKAPKDVAVRKVLGEVKTKKEDPVTPDVTMDDVLALSEEEEQKLARERAVKAILGQVKKRS